MVYDREVESVLLTAPREGIALYAQLLTSLNRDPPRDLPGVGSTRWIRIADLADLVGTQPPGVPR
jgi:hypothetical protein